MIKTWKTLRRTRVADAPVFSIEKIERQPPFDAEPANFYVVHLPDWVNVIAVTDEKKVVLIRQYRHGTDAVTLEIPGGNVDDGEAFEDAARRELREETGYDAERFVEIGEVEPNPAIQSNRCKTFLALDARRTHEPAPDEHEEIEVVLAERERLEELVDSGEITHALVVAAIYHLRRWERRHG